MKYRRKTPLNKAEDKADKALQDKCRTLKMPCEACGKPSDCVHHYIEKSLSLGLRFEKLNLIFICKGCHFRHHNVGDASIMDKVILKRGVAWLKKLEKLRLERKEWKKSIKFYEEQYELWTKNTEIKSTPNSKK